jgi:trk system potassium uptake protein TrkA
MMTLVKLHRGEVSIVEEKIEAGAPAAGKMIRDVPLPTGCTLAAVMRGSEVILPRGDTLLQPEDEVVAVVRSGLEVELNQLFTYH